MLERIVYALMVALLALLAWQDYASAEDQPPKVRALYERLNVEIGNTLTCSENAYILLDKIKDLQAKLDAAQKSPEPKKD